MIIMTIMCLNKNRWKTIPKAKYKVFWYKQDHCTQVQKISRSGKNDGKKWQSKYHWDGYGFIFVLMMEIVNQDVLGDFDFTRSDKLYSLKVPSYSVEKGIVYYQFQLRDLIYNELYYSNFRYNELRDIH